MNIRIAEYLADRTNKLQFIDIGLLEVVGSYYMYTGICSLF